jgi:hypothetical protein
MESLFLVWSIVLCSVSEIVGKSLFIGYVATID